MASPWSCSEHSSVRATSSTDGRAAVVRRSSVQEAATSFEESLRALVEAQIEGLETAVGDLEGDVTIEVALQGAAATVAAGDAARANVGTIPNCAVVAGQEAVEEESEE